MAVGLVDDMGRAFATCTAPLQPVPEAAYQLIIREPALPYPGRVSPMPTDVPPALPRNPNMPTAGGDESMCSAAPGRANGGAAWLALGLLGLVIRRRRA